MGAITWGPGQMACLLQLLPARRKLKPHLILSITFRCGHCHTALVLFDLNSNIPKNRLTGSYNLILHGLIYPMLTNTRPRFAWLKKILRWILICCCLVAIALITIFFALRGPENIKYKGPKAVYIEKSGDKFILYRNGKPFEIKGGAGFSHLEDLKLAGGNTLILWDTSALKTTLNEAEKFGLSVIIGLDIPAAANTNFYTDTAKTKAIKSRYQKIIGMYSHHPALLAWCLGNEINFTIAPAYNSFFRTYNELLEMLHQTDPGHPVCMTMVNLPKRTLLMARWRIPAIDFIGFNTYSTLEDLKANIKGLQGIWNGPFFISEWAPRGGWEAPVTGWGAPIENSSTQKAADYYKVYKAYMPFGNPQFLGSLAFYWGNRYEYTNTWFSVYNENGIPNEMKEALHDCWTDSITRHISPAVQHILIDDSLRAESNVLLAAGSIHHAGIILKGTERADSLRFSWEIMKEEWSVWGKTWVNFKKPPNEAGCMKDSSLAIAEFAAPLKTGPYRICLSVYNRSGYAATANLPFYVIQ